MLLHSRGIGLRRVNSHQSVFSFREYVRDTRYMQIIIRRVERFPEPHARVRRASARAGLLN